MGSPFPRAVPFILSVLLIFAEFVFAKHAAGITRHYKFDVRTNSIWTARFNSPKLRGFNLLMVSCCFTDDYR